MKIRFVCGCTIFVFMTFAMLVGARGAWAACPGQECNDRCCDVVAGASQNYSHNLSSCDTLGTPSDPNTPDGVCVICTYATGTTINGAGIDETICGSSGDDTINGKGGNDTVLGLDGDDTLDVSVSRTPSVDLA